jgi:hypothetical protein
LQDIQFIFNRALSRTFNSKKFLLVFTILLMCGLLVVFFRGLSFYTGHWITMSLTFLPVFLCAGVLLALGIFLIRIYHDEIKKHHASYRAILSNSWDIIIGTSYLCIPIILSYLLLWMLLGIFFLLNDIPVLGNVFSVLLAFGPFLLNLGALLLCVLSLSMLFFVVPIIALRGLNRIQLAQILAKRLHNDIFLNVFLMVIAVIPFAAVFSLLAGAAILTGTISYHFDNHMLTILQSFIMMIPFTAILSFPVIFFFNFAAEAHALLQKLSRTTST